MQTAAVEMKSNDAASTLIAVEQEVEEAQRRLAEARARADEERRATLAARLAPLEAKAGELGATLAAVDARVDVLLRDAVRRARVLYSELVAAHNERNEVELEMARIAGQQHETFPPVGFAAFVETRVKSFHFADVTREGPGWARGD